MCAAAGLGASAEAAECGSDHWSGCNAVSLRLPAAFFTARFFRCILLCDSRRQSHHPHSLFSHSLYSQFVTLIRHTHFRHPLCCSEIVAPCSGSTGSVSSAVVRLFLGSEGVSDAVQADDPRGDLRHPPGMCLSACLHVPEGGGGGGERGRETGERGEEGPPNVGGGHMQVPPLGPGEGGGRRVHRGTRYPLRRPPATLLPLPRRRERGLQQC